LRTQETGFEDTGKALRISKQQTVEGPKASVLGGGGLQKLYTTTPMNKGGDLQEKLRPQGSIRAEDYLTEAGRAADYSTMHGSTKADEGIEDLKKM